MVPITRSAKGFCHGECGVVRTSARPMAFTRCRNCPPKMRRAWRSRNRRADDCSTASRLPIPERAETPAVPANHGPRLNDMERFAPPCPPLREPHPEYAVEETDPRSLGTAAEQGELLSQRQVLKNEVGAALQRSAQSAQESE